ncbi:PD-(D/E)XK nuclease-like domain-containing protein [Paenibacillus sp. UMB4589-SE434]|uniref:PD-(D/E)XK nuclease-like domain-containing protein n=1 Tax=Paenibacillus sp. UMB4589-SE434 TaxID=3046314 RepID=UPI00254AC09B|nr:PD-(D/E)XK nuclease-like domain-containing protein [Paenibacillus sp. UMB4589-SE434]MDK8182076.1 PD-(D/E)XK nuclease-like domain-containing protein [Paenibacillus sp. UMB4589-SE434]
MELTKENYYSLEANLHYMSVSQFKSFLPSYGGCEAQAMAKISGEYVEPQKNAFDEGHYVHAWNEGTLEEFKVNNPQIYASAGKTAGQLKANYQHCNKMITVLQNDPLVMKALAGQKEVIMSAELFGIPWKAMLDSYQPEVGIFTDLKALKEIDGKWWNKDAQAYENFLDHYGYTIQMAVYAEIERLFTGGNEWLLPQMVVVTKQDPPDHEIIYFDYEIIEASLQIVQNNIERVKAVKAGLIEPLRCERCEYCRLTKKIKRIKHFSELSLY